MVDRNAYLCQVELAAGHRKFGKVNPRKEPKDEEESGGNEGFEPPKNHPLLGAAAQFSGEFENDNPVAFDNAEAKKELQLRLEAKLEHQKKLQASNQAAPTPTPFR